MNQPTFIVGYLALFAIVGFLFIFLSLVLGRFLRPKAPNAEKLEIYECGEPTIGSSFVQFDLRFYVVALLFIIFDVEVAFFFPWAVVYGKATHLMDPNLKKIAAELDPARPANELSPNAAALYKELGVPNPTVPKLPQRMAKALGPEVSEAERGALAVQTSSRQLALVSLFDIGVFFAVLLVGFAYVWKRGDLDWVRSTAEQRAETPVATEKFEAIEQSAALAS